MKTGGCPRCGGDTYIDADTYEVFTSCLQCGAIVDRKKVKRYQNLPAAITEEEVKTIRRRKMDERNARIYQAYLDGSTYCQIGKQFCLNKMTIRYICIMQKLKKEAKP